MVVGWQSDEVDGEEAVVVYIFHETEDYLNKLDKQPDSK